MNRSIDDHILENTTSLCPSCLRPIPAHILTDGSIVYIDKKCPEHGASSGVIWNSLEKYLWARDFKPGHDGSFRGCCDAGKCAAGCDISPTHFQHTCLAILEVTDSCNLGCPICLMSAGKDNSDNPSLEEIGHALDSLIEHEGRTTPLQFSGGEPSVRSDLPEIIGLARKKGFRYVEIDTNGVKLARDPKLAEEYVEAGLDGIYLQFDGITDDVYEAIRGAKLVRVKEKAITNARKAGLHVVLAVTAVRGINDSQFWPIVDYAIKNRLNGVNFQPFAMFGRYPANLLNPMDRITNPDVMKLLQLQSGGRIREEDFIPVPCPDNRCQMLSYIKLNHEDVTPVSRLLDVDSVVDYYRRFTDVDLMDGAISKLRQTFGKLKGATMKHEKAEDCLPCSNLPSPKDDERFFAISTHGMMDAWNSDVHRHERCCVHEVTLDGKIIPFCLYNMTSVTGEPLYRLNQPDQPTWSRALEVPNQLVGGPAGTSLNL